MAAHEYDMSDPEPWQCSHHEAQKEIARLQAERDELAREVEEIRSSFIWLENRHVTFRIALKSIARNTCCEGCQEAALVARAALKGNDA